VFFVFPAALASLARLHWSGATRCGFVFPWPSVARVFFRFSGGARFARADAVERHKEVWFRFSLALGGPCVFSLFRRRSLRSRGCTGAAQGGVVSFSLALLLVHVCFSLFRRRSLSLWFAQLQWSGLVSFSLALPLADTGRTRVVQTAV
jgi:hypothetical protein